MGSWPSADELALDLDDVAPLLPEAVRKGEISSEAEHAVRLVSDKLGAMSGQQNALSGLLRRWPIRLNGQRLGFWHQRLCVS
jgi:hypothetical protein